MARGFFKGAVVGTVIATVGLSALSLWAPMRPVVVAPPEGAPARTATPVQKPAEAAMPEKEARAPSTTAPASNDDAATPAPASETPDRPAHRPAPQDTVAAKPAPAITAPQVVEDAPPDTTLTRPAARPQAGGEAIVPTAPEEEPGTSPRVPSVAVGSVPSVANGAGTAPTAPAADAEPAISIVPAQPPVPGVPQTLSALEEPTPQLPDTPAVAVPPAQAPEPGQAARPASEAAPSAAGTSAPLPQSDTAPVLPGTADDGVEPTPQAPSAGAQPAVTPPPPPVARPAGEAAPSPSVATAPLPQSPAATEPEKPVVRRLVPDRKAEPQGAEEVAVLRPRIGKPAGSLVDRNDGAGRLPVIGAEPDAPAQPAAEAEATPLERYAAKVTVEPGVPRMSVVLIDDGTGPLGPNAVEAFPFPVTFALDPLQPDVADRMAAYRALGYEVAVLIRVPEAAKAADVEQALAAAVRAVPEAVALVEAPGSNIQRSREIADQATAFAAAGGYGLVFLPEGLNTAEALARRKGVPVKTVFRDFDGSGQDARAKRRFLDGTAFRARQDGAAVTLGRLTPDTVSALVLWGLQDRASSVALVPLSLILSESVAAE